MGSGSKVKFFCFSLSLTLGAVTKGNAVRIALCRVSVCRGASIFSQGFKTGTENEPKNQAEVAERKRKRGEKKKAEISKRERVAHFSNSFVKLLISSLLPPRRAHHKQPWPPPSLPGKRHKLQSPPWRKRERAKAPATRERAPKLSNCFASILSRPSLPTLLWAQQAAAFFFFV